MGMAFVVKDNRGLNVAYYNENGFPFWGKYASEATHYDTEERATKIADQLRKQHAGRGEIVVKEMWV